MCNLRMGQKPGCSGESWAFKLISLSCALCSGAGTQEGSMAPHVVVHKHVSLKQLGTWARRRGACREARLLPSGWQGSGEQAAVLRVMCVRGRVALTGHRHVYDRGLFQSGLFPLIPSVRSTAPRFHFSEPYSSVKISKYHLQKKLCMHPCVYTYLYLYITPTTYVNDNIKRNYCD